MELDYHILWIIGLVLSLTVILDRLVFRPVLAIIQKREEAAASARALAERATEEARAAALEFERKTSEARAEVYRQMDEMRRAALEDRTRLIEVTREEADQALAKARVALDHDVQEATARLDREADALAVEAASRILGRRAS